MKYIWAFLIIISIAACVANGGNGQALTAMLDGVSSGLTLCVSLGAGCILFMGFSNVAQDAGLMDALAKLLGKPIQKLFRGVYAGSRAASAIALNLAANMLGLGNAATPFGLEAMRELYGRHPSKRASAAMCMLLCVNISSVQIIPTSVIALRAQYGSADPAGIMLPSLISTAATTISAILLAKMCEKP